jgi:hypothetical protein
MISFTSRTRAIHCLVIFLYIPAKISSRFLTKKDHHTDLRLTLTWLMSGGPIKAPRRRSRELDEAVHQTMGASNEIDYAILQAERDARRAASKAAELTEALDRLTGLDSSFPVTQDMLGLTCEELLVMSPTSVTAAIEAEPEPFSHENHPIQAASSSTDANEPGIQAPKPRDCVCDPGKAHVPLPCVKQRKGDTRRGVGCIWGV